MAIGAHPEAPSLTADGKHFSCSMSAVLIARVREYGGAPAVAELLRAPGQTAPWST